MVVSPKDLILECEVAKLRAGIEDQVKRILMVIMYLFVLVVIMK